MSFNIAKFDNEAAVDGFNIIEVEMNVFKVHNTYYSKIITDLPLDITCSIFFFCSGEEYRSMELTNKKFKLFFNKAENRKLWFAAIKAQMMGFKIQFSKDLSFKSLFTLFCVKTYPLKGSLASHEKNIKNKKCECVSCCTVEARLMKEILSCSRIKEKHLEYQELIKFMNQAPKTRKLYNYNGDRLFRCTKCKGNVFSDHVDEVNYASNDVSCSRRDISDPNPSAGWRAWMK